MRAGRGGGAEFRKARGEDQIPSIQLKAVSPRCSSNTWKRRKLSQEVPWISQLKLLPQALFQKNRCEGRKERAGGGGQDNPSWSFLSTAVTSAQGLAKQEPCDVGPSTLRSFCVTDTPFGHQTEGGVRRSYKGTHLQHTLSRPDHRTSGASPTSPGSLECRWGWVILLAICTS